MKLKAKTEIAIVRISETTESGEYHIPMSDILVVPKGTVVETEDDEGYTHTMTPKEFEGILFDLGDIDVSMWEIMGSRDENISVDSAVEDLLKG